MGYAIKLILIKIVKNLIAMMGTAKMVFWGLEELAELSDNQVDDNVVKFTKAAYNNNQEDVIKYAEAVINEIKNKKDSENA